VAAWLWQAVEVTHLSLVDDQPCHLFFRNRYTKCQLNGRLLGGRDPSVTNAWLPLGFLSQTAISLHRDGVRERRQPVV